VQGEKSEGSSDPQMKKRSLMSHLARGGARNKTKRRTEQREGVKKRQDLHVLCYKTNESGGPIRFYPKIEGERDDKGAGDHGRSQR